MGPGHADAARAARIYSERHEDVPLCEPERLFTPFERIVAKLGKDRLVATGLVPSGNVEGMERLEVQTAVQETFLVEPRAASAAARRAGP